MNGTTVHEIAGRLARRTPDALHLATAINSGSNAFLTNDLALKRVKEIQVIVLDELELDQEKDSIP